MTKNYRSGRPLEAGFKLASKQQGLSFAPILAIVAILVFLTMTAFKIGPYYMEYMTVKKIATDISKDDELMSGTKSNIVKKINQQYHTNSLWDLKAKDTVNLQKDGNKGYLVTVNYEKRINLFANIDVVTVFNKAVNGD